MGKGSGRSREMPGPYPSNDRQLKDAVIQLISVTPQKIAIAKAIVLEHAHKFHELLEFIGTVNSAQKVQAPRQIHCHQEYDSTVQIQSLADEISWSLATAEALISLVNDSQMVLTSNDYRPLNFHCVVTMGWHESPSYKGSINFEEYGFLAPSRVRLAPSFEGGKSQLLANSDLYLQTFCSPGMHQEVTLALQEAVKCFRHGFFGAAVAMLGKASEGAWIELGTSLLNAVPEDKRSSVDKLRKTLENERAGAAMKMDAVLAIFEKQDIFGPLAASSGVSLDSLRMIWEWSNIVRNHRNTIHFGVTSVIPITYETVATLLLGALQYLRDMYALKSAAELSALAAPP
jgi:hypothetical protein